MWYGSIEMVEEMVKERHRDAANAALVAELRAADPGASQRGLVRHAVALGFAAISRSSVAAVRRLDRCLADDLTRTMATGERS